MVVLVVGVPDSGKSVLAENVALELSGENKRIYLATMEILDEAGYERVKKHRKLREGKVFFTIEAPVRTWEAVSGQPDLKDSTVLIECISNLVGNVMHDENFMKTEGAQNLRGSAVRAVVSDVEQICRVAKNVVIVTNSFAQRDEFDEETKEYITCLDEVNARLRNLADTVYEFVEGEWHKSEDN